MCDNTPQGPLPRPEVRPDLEINQNTKGVWYPPHRNSLASAAMADSPEFEQKLKTGEIVLPRVFSQGWTQDRHEQIALKGLITALNVKNLNFAMPKRVAVEDLIEAMEKNPGPLSCAIHYHILFTSDSRTPRPLMDQEMDHSSQTVPNKDPLAFNLLEWLPNLNDLSIRYKWTSLTDRECEQLCMAQVSGIHVEDHAALAFCKTPMERYRVFIAGY